MVNAAVMRPLPMPRWCTVPSVLLAALLAALVSGCAGDPLDPLPPMTPGTDANQVVPYDGPSYDFRTTARGFEVRRGNGPWQPFYQVGMNFGTAIPGTSPGDFTATRAQLARWIEATADLGCNSIRTYTVQSPTFYEELRRWNVTHPDRPLFLLQGAWLHEPEDATPDYLSPAIRLWWRDEIERVIDAVHGNRTLPPGSWDRPNNYGRAHGVFRADVSPWLMGWLIGREIEPYTIRNSHALHPQERSYQGAYFSLSDATPIETFVVGNLDYTVAYEMQHYRAQHPVGFSNWPTLDPLRHETEPPLPHSVEDTYSIHLDRVRINEAAFDRGMFMSYHAYPYYPDFILYAPEYQVRDAQGVNSYLGYLRALRAFHRNFAVIIAETGIPSSQGPAHMAPSGMNHGGLNELEQGRALARELETVVAAEMNGFSIFAIIDEWFKRTWIVDMIDAPRERRQYWHNMMSPEQNFGLLGIRAGPVGRHHVVDGRENDWSRAPQVVGQSAPLVPARDGYDPARTLRDLTIEHDEAYLHLRLRVENLDPDGDGRPDWDRVDYLFAFDTLDPNRGDSRLSPDGLLGVERRVEFVLRIDGASAATLSVDRPYDLFGAWHRFREPWQLYRTTANDAGVFNLMRTITNAEYVYRDQTLAAQISPEIGRLPTGAEAQNSNTNFWYDARTGVIEVRVPWNLLQFSDPSRRMVVDGDGAEPRTLATRQTSEVAVMVVSFSGAGENESTVADSLPRARPSGAGWVIPAAGAARYTWPVWDTPTWHEYRKASFDVLRDALPRFLPASRRPPLG